MEGQNIFKTFIDANSNKKDYFKKNNYYDWMF